MIRFADPASLIAADGTLSLALRTNRDHRDLTQLVLEPDEASERFFRGRAPTTDAECAEMFGSADELVRTIDGEQVLHLWFPVRRVEDGVLVGWVQVQCPDGRQPELIVYIGTEFRRGGYATAALRLTIDLLFAATDTKWVEAVVAEDNPSRKIVHELGFQDEGPLSVADGSEEHIWLLPPGGRTWL